MVKHWICFMYAFDSHVYDKDNRKKDPNTCRIETKTITYDNGIDYANISLRIS